MEQAEVLARLRKEKGLSQAEVAEELGVTRQAVSRWESGRAWPSAEKLVAVSRLYGVTVEELCREVIAEKPEADKGAVEQIPESSNATVQEGKEDPCRRKRWSRFCAVIVVISIYIFIYIWGVLTNSQHTATDNLGNFLKKFCQYGKYALLFLLLTCALLLPACGEQQQPPEPEKGVLIYAALNPVTRELTRTVKNFNEVHPDAQIEIRDYSDAGGRERLQTEMALGQVPDIMELRCYGEDGEDMVGIEAYSFLPGSYTGPADGYFTPYRQMAQRGYLEDLWPYIENDPELGREGVLEAPLKAAEVNGGLYMLFQRVVIFTLIGRERVVGARYSWTLDDVMETLAAMPEGSTILRYDMTRRDAFFNLLSCSLERYVDRETGACSFDSESFRSLVEFLDGLPAEVDYEKAQDAEEEIIRRIKDGRQMLEGITINWPRDIGRSDSIFHERAAFVGYPTADGSSGNFFYLTGTVLGMSSVCRNKDAAWDYIRQLIAPSFEISKHTLVDSVVTHTPVNLNDYEALYWYELNYMAYVLRRFPEDPLENYISTHHFKYGPEIKLMEPITEEHLRRHRDLIDHTTQLYWPNDELANIVWETLGPYFAGDRALDDTIGLLNNRVGLYLHEQQ